MDEFSVSTTLTSDVLKRYSNLLWKFFVKKLPKSITIKIMYDICILLSILLFIYNFYFKMTTGSLSAVFHSTNTFFYFALVLFTVVFRVNVKHIIMGPSLKLLKKHTNSQLQYCFNENGIFQNSIENGDEKEIKISDITNVIKKNDLILFTKSHKSILTHIAMIDLKQLNEEELEQINLFLHMFIECDIQY